MSLSGRSVLLALALLFAGCTVKVVTPHAGPDPKEAVRERARASEEQLKKDVKEQNESSGK